MSIVTEQATYLRSGSAVLAALALMAAGCGGGSHGSGHGASSPHGAPGTAGAARLAPGSDGALRGARSSATTPGLLGGATSAGTAVSYVPRGEIVADSGFRPQLDGFDFENYGNDAGPVNLTTTNVEDLFGSQVCQTGSGATCVLSSAARHWEAQVDASMADGHCMGFSVTALRFFTGNLKPASYGASRTFALPIQGNDRLQSLIAEDFAYQDLPAVTDRVIGGTPTQVLEALVTALRAHRESYTLGIVKSDGSGGHAITPIAVEDRGRGLAAIIVYDNNFPGILRAVDVDTRTDTWRYVGGINPADTSEIYSGSASTKSMVLIPTSPGETTQPCPFCAVAGSRLPGAHSTLLDKLHYIEVGITSHAAQHPHLLFTDPQGRRTGYVNGILLQQIPGIQVVSNYSVQNWNAAPEPVFHLPLGHPAYRVTVDGSTLTSPTVTTLQVNGAGIVFSVNDIHIAPGQKDTMLLTASDLGITYVSTSQQLATPVVAAQFAQYDAAHSTTSQQRFRLITVVSAGDGFTPGSPVTLYVDPQSNRVGLASFGDRRRSPGARYFLSVDSSPIGSGGAPEDSFLTDGLPLPPDAAAQFFYSPTTAAKLPVTVISSAGKVLGVFPVPRHHAP